MPIPTVGFCQMLHTVLLILGTNFLAKTISQTLPFLNTQSNIERQISDCDTSHFTATIYMWTSASGDPYIIYAINQQWQLKSYCLQTHYLPQNHTAVNIKEVLLETTTVEAGSR